jgi:CheY-like chemotaxis protein
MSNLPASSSPGPAHELPRVLLAEDNPISQKVGLLLLRGLGYRPDMAGNGLEVLSALDGDDYDVILMDVHMPEMDGMEATRRIRADLEPERQPAIIAMTASAEAEDRALCLQAGMDDHLIKPVRADALAAVLEWWGPTRPRGVGAPPYVAVAAAGLEAQAETAGEAENGAVSRGPQAAGRAEPAVDPAVFEAFAANIVGPDVAARSQLIDTYLTDARARVEDLRAGGAAPDVGAVVKAAHGLRSGSALFGALPLARLLQELETTGRAGTADVGRMIERIQIEFADVADHLDRLRAGQATMAG